MAEVMNKADDQISQQFEGIHVVKKVHADGFVDMVDARAIGGALENMPPAYYYSIQFIGTVTVCRLLYCCHPHNFAFEPPFER